MFAPTVFRTSFWTPLVAVTALALGLLSCDGTGMSDRSESAPTPVSLSFSTESGGAAGTAGKTSGGLLTKGVTVTDPDGNTLQLDKVQMILREIEFKKADAAENCRPSEEADDCEELEAGPILVSLPLDTDQPAVVIDTTLPPGQWTEVSFEVHKLEDDDPAAQSILEGTTFPPDASIRAQGTFTPAGGTQRSFTFTSDLNEEREIEFEPPIDVTQDEPTNITFSVDVGTWFRGQDGGLVDPSKAGDDGPFEDLVEENIESSIEGFEDDDRDGDDDREDEEEEEDEEEDESETEIEADLENTGPDPDASGEAEYEEDGDQREFEVEVEDLDAGTYQVVVDDTTRGEIDVTATEDGTEGEIEFRSPPESGHPTLDFTPVGKRVEVVQDGTVFLETDFSSGDSDDDGGDYDGDKEAEADLKNTGPDPDASGEAEYEEEDDRRTFEVEVEDLNEGTYELVVADTTRADFEVDEEGEGEIELRDPSESGHPPLTFDPLGKHVAVAQDGTVFLEVDFPTAPEDD
ncbi:MAG: hypothetical protein V5A22_08090 [Salinivenus sp.]